MSLKQDMLAKDLLEHRVFDLLDASMGTQESLLSAVNNFNVYSALKLKIDHAFLVQKISVPEKNEEIPISVAEAIIKKDFLLALLKSSLKLNYIDLYDKAREEYLELQQAIELHLVTHDSKGKITRNGKKSKTEGKNPSPSSKED